MPKNRQGNNKHAASRKTKKTATKKPAATFSGTIGYRHMPLKKKRFTKQSPPKNFRKLPNAFHITKAAVLLVWNDRKLFFGIALIHGLLNLVLVQGFSNNSEINSLKSQLQKGSVGAVTSSLSIFAVLVGSAGNGGSSTAGAYQLPLVIIASLAIIWALRQVKSNNKIRIRDAYYKGMYPLIPFILVLLLVTIQLLPLVIGAALYSAVVTNGIAIGILQNIVFLLIFLVLAAWSIRLVSSSLFALYIVTLPDMTPLKALRSAKQLVRFHRLSLFRKLLFLPFVLLIAAAVVMLPIILLITVLSQWVFFILTMLALLFVHAYVYTIYRELLNE